MGEQKVWREPSEAPTYGPKMPELDPASVRRQELESWHGAER